MFHNHKTKHLTWKHDFDSILINFVVFLSMLYLLILAAELYLPNTWNILYFIVLYDTLISIIFFFEFMYFLRKSKNKWKYTKENFIDLLSAFPGLLLIYLFSNLYLIFILFKFIRGFESLFKVLEVIRERKFRLLSKIVLMFVFVVVYFSILLVYVEQDQNLSLGTFHDGLWLTVTTITSVGYGDVTPESYMGKVIAIILMVFGIGISSAVGALFVAWLLKPAQDKIYSQELKISREEKEIEKREKRQTNMDRKILKKMDDIEKEIKSLKKKRRK